MVWADRIIGGLIILASIPLWLTAGRFPHLAGAFPKTVIVAIAGLAALMIVRSVFGRRPPRGDGRMEPGALVLPLLVALASLGAVVAMRFFGFFPAMIGLVAALFFVLAGHRRLLFLASAVVSLAFIYVVFVLLLDVPI